jgi:flagellar biogenesis protein FliO
MDILRQSLGIALVFALLWAGLWLVKRKGALRTAGGKSSAGPRPIESRGKLVLSAQHSVHLIRVADREVLVGVHPSGCSVICDLGAAAALPLNRTAPLL